MELEGDTITIDKHLNHLDKFVIGFLKVFEKHSSYVLVSGYVSILLGRSRISEDIDLLCPTLNKESFLTLHDDLLKAGFYCLNADDTDELYDTLNTRHSIRYAKEHNPLPNMEVKFAHTRAHKAALKNRITVKLPKTMMRLSPLELQIIYKEQVLGSDKDKEDALHLRKVFDQRLSTEKLNYYERVVREDG
ncbi:hypothetical protein KY327_03755 [Candidatus Woesearchaeota archaeon]|nr:hypothetical protein [Candidatus Woesearchaeota archaeon]